MHLLKDSYRLKVAVNGEQALEVVQLELPDLILLDIIMPGIDGYEVCRRLKAEPSTSKIPVIFLTAMTDVADEQLGFEVGAVDFILKPVSPPILLARVRNHLLLFQLLNNLKNQNEIIRCQSESKNRRIRAYPRCDYFSDGFIGRNSRQRYW
ncbi:response regulator [uncultured Deefgea sp.]|uniref:response regulator n=1 Tax=uncultured Deefgea sp. TaxID=1304914 RepID=UPI002597A48D|nr:response regulator [uncultured Deefgea sp.]